MCFNCYYIYKFKTCWDHCTLRYIYISESKNCENINHLAYTDIDIPYWYTNIPIINVVYQYILHLGCRNQLRLFFIKICNFLNLQSLLQNGFTDKIEHWHHNRQQIKFVNACHLGMWNVNYIQTSVIYSNKIISSKFYFQN